MVRPEVTVAVPVKNRRDRMLECLEAILAQDHPSFEVIVLDNDSSDGTAQACRERAARADVPVRVEVVPGTLGAVRNRARALARGRVIAYTDSDCSPVPGWLSAGVHALDADPALGFVCGATLPPHRPARNWARAVEVREFSWRFESCNIFFRADAFRDSAGFDEVVGDGWEDTAAGFDLLRRGWRPGFAADAVVHHDVTYPGFWWHVRREQRQANVGRVAKRYPEIRRRLMFARVFHSRRNAFFLLALLGFALPRARLLTLPYAMTLMRRRWPHRMVQLAVFDASIEVARMRGALRYRCFLL